MYMVSDVVELLLVFSLFFTGLPSCTLPKNGSTGKEEAVDDED